VEAFNRLRAQGVRVGTQDMKIASIALAHGVLLLTRNSLHFAKVPGLRFENWLDLIRRRRRWPARFSWRFVTEKGSSLLPGNSRICSRDAPTAAISAENSMAFVQGFD